jgi:hypothetical protein
MSIRAIDWALRQDIKLPTDKFVLVILANYVGDTGLAFPSTQTISRITGLCRRSVIQALDRLVEQRWIEDTGKRTGTTKQIKAYRLSAAIESGKGAPDTPLKGAADASLKGAPGASKGAADARLRVQQMHPEPLEESFKEPIREDILKIDALQKLSEVVEIFKQDPRFDGLDVDAEVKRLKVWAKKKNMGVSKRLLRYWLDNAERNLEEDDDEELYHEEPYYSWAGWTEERRRALRELWPGVVEPPTRWDKVSADIKKEIEARVKEGWG